MHRSHLLAFAVTAACATFAHAAPASLLPASNPFAKPSTLPFQYPAFDKIKNEDFAPAFDEGMRQHSQEIDAIANNKAAPTFENTIVAMERAGQLLNRVSTVFPAWSAPTPTTPWMPWTRTWRRSWPRTATRSA
jgi:peptidyl-dipeptidase Dcp